MTEGRGYSQLKGYQDRQISNLSGRPARISAFHFEGGASPFDYLARADQMLDQHRWLVGWVRLRSVPPCK